MENGPHGPTDGEENRGVFSRISPSHNTTDGYPWLVNHDSSPAFEAGGRGRCRQLSAICQARKKDGTRCSLPAQEQQDRCWAHDERNAAQRRRIASRGGKGKANTPVKELQQQLDDNIIARVLDGELVPYRGSVAAQIINAKIRLLEIERRAQEQREGEERLERLECLERNRGRAGRGAGFWGA